MPLVSPITVEYSLESTVDRGEFVDLQETPDGRLQVILSSKGRDGFPMIEEIRREYGEWTALRFLLADRVSTDWELVPGRDLGIATVAPILGRDIERDLDGRVVSASRIYWYPMYLDLNAIDCLRHHGTLELLRAA